VGIIGVSGYLRFLKTIGIFDKSRKNYRMLNKLGDFGN